MDIDTQKLIEDARKQARIYRSKVMNCVDGTGKSDGEWSQTAALLTRLCDVIDGTPPEARCAIEFAILFGADPDLAENMKSDPKFIQDCKESAKKLNVLSRS